MKYAQNRVFGPKLDKVALNMHVILQYVVDQCKTNLLTPHLFGSVNSSGLYSRLYKIF
jgi:hypothetical protein